MGFYFVFSDLQFVYHGTAIQNRLTSEFALAGANTGSCQVRHVEHFEEILCLLINLDGLLQLGHVRNVVISLLTLLFLKLDGDSPDSGLLKTLHQVGDETCDLVPQRLGRDQGDLLNDDLGGLLDGLGTDTTHLERVGSKKIRTCVFG